MNIEQERDRFEQAALEHFMVQRAAGAQIADDNGCEATRETLFWRDDAGNYGVKMFNAAWWGWKKGIEAESGGEHTTLELRAQLDESFEEKKKGWFCISQQQKAIANLIAERDTLRAALLKTQETLKQFYDYGYDRGECWMAGGIINSALANTNGVRDATPT